MDDVRDAGAPRSCGPEGDDPKRVDILKRETLSDGYLRVEALTLRAERFQGGMGPEVRREVVYRGVAAALLPYDPVRDEVVLLRQFRPGLFEGGHAGWDFEIVAGIVDGDDSPEDTVRRECVEECGLTVHDLRRVAHFFPSPGISTETVTIFVGRVDAENAGGVFGVPEEGEDIRVTSVPAAAFLKMLEPGDDAAKGDAEGRCAFLNACAIIAAQWFALNHQKLRADWLADIVQP